MELQLSVRKQQGDFVLELDLKVSGERIGIFGPSGSGKSTLVSCLAGLAKPDAGQILLDGQPLFNSRSRVNLAAHQRRIALVFQQHGLFPHLDVRKNLLYGYQRCPSAERRIELAEVVEVLELADLMDQMPQTLSGGQSQRVALGRAILASPRLLLMDEPLSALDDDLRYRIIPYLNLVSGRFGIPFVFISHSLVEMRLMADQVAVLEKGGLAGVVSPEQLARQRMGQSPAGYTNLLELGVPQERQGLLAYPWAGLELLLSGTKQPEAGMFELSSKDIILCKRHPDAISARNLLPCTVRSLFEAGSKIGVELDCKGGILVAEVVPDAVRELEVTTGSIIWAAIKASAFRRL
ncbi:molybdenum ABC transporter ATP-binding protein [Trichlorobacter lovleyi]|uniref:molybdenum ABC transporter ATP-binding protein n=1 Tax=Trichlorobacter lovleyi TaxID=313985 RepID=UPI0022403469|nr:molybdenum ABC transporter ATP-binding protein [Trichlorobacter lovleyi]QOX77681.1 molybdenum ABC transporter ATP-binding protein [Trichlorobacter lovleyi]